MLIYKQSMIQQEVTARKLTDEAPLKDIQCMYFCKSIYRGAPGNKFFAHKFSIFLIVLTFSSALTN